MNNESNHEPHIETPTETTEGQETDQLTELDAQAPTTGGIPEGVLQDSNGQFQDGRYNYAAHRSMPRADQPAHQPADHEE